MKSSKNLSQFFHENDDWRWGESWIGDASSNRRITVFLTCLLIKLILFKHKNWMSQKIVWILSTSKMAEILYNPKWTTKNLTTHEIWLQTKKLEWESLPKFLHVTPPPPPPPPTYVHERMLCRSLKDSANCKFNSCLLNLYFTAELYMEVHGSQSPIKIFRVSNCILKFVSSLSILNLKT